MTTMHILVADIGGTNTRFASFICDNSGQLSQGAVRYLNTSNFDSFGQLFRQLLTDSLQAGNNFSTRLVEFDAIVMAAAGPVMENRYCYPPNIKWNIDLAEAEKEIGSCKITLINDFVAQAFSCLSPLIKEAKVVLAAKGEKQGAFAAIGPGTGLGKALLLPNPKGGYLALPSEGGHNSFCPENEEELKFCRFILKFEKGAYATWDDVVSGRGLSYLHEFLTGVRLTPAEIGASLEQHPETLSWFARFIGRACRQYALETLALGGIYIMGGVAVKNPIIFDHPGFRTDFLCSASFAEILGRIPVYLLQNELSGLWGAAYFGKTVLKNGFKTEVES